jgi:hypothetical protein
LTVKEVAEAKAAASKAASKALHAQADKFAKKRKDLEVKLAKT